MSSLWSGPIAQCSMAWSQWSTTILYAYRYNTIQITHIFGYLAIVSPSPGKSYLDCSFTQELYPEKMCFTQNVNTFFKQSHTTSSYSTRITRIFTCSR